MECALSFLAKYAMNLSMNVILPDLFVLVVIFKVVVVTGISVVAVVMLWAGVDGAIEVVDDLSVVGGSVVEVVFGAVSSKKIKYKCTFS